MTREDAINEYIIPAIKSKWNDKVCEEIIKALNAENKQNNNTDKDKLK